MKKNTQLKVYDITGRLVRKIDVESNGDSYATIYWDGKTGKGKDASSGIYFASYSADDNKETVKVVLLR